MSKIVFILVPTADKTNVQIAKRIEKIKNYVKELAAEKFGWDILDICTIDTFRNCLLDGMELSEYDKFYKLSKDIATMQIVDAVYFDADWVDDKTCLIERVTCKLYDIPCLYYEEFWMGYITKSYVLSLIRR